MSVDLDAIRLILREELESRSRIDCEVHASHHDFIAALLTRAQRRDARWEKIKTQVLGWAVIGVLGSLAVWSAREFGRFVANITGHNP